MSRRNRIFQRPMTAVLAMGLLLVSILPTVMLTSCGRRGAYTSTYLDVFDTVLTVTVGADSHEDAAAVTTAIHDIALDLHRRFDIYHTYDGITNLCDVNRAAGGDPVKVDIDILSLLQMGRAVYLRSQGTVNVMIGALTSLWHDARIAGGPIPDPAALDAACTHISIDALVIDWESHTVAITDPRASLDVGALAKGYVMKQVQEYARREGIDSLLVNLGGHILALGNHPDGDAWRVSVARPGDTPLSLSVTDASVVTSADNQRTFRVDGVDYHHIIDPATAYPATAHRSVTILVPLPHTAEADAYSTALFILPDADGRSLLDEIDGARLIHKEGGMP